MYRAISSLYCNPRSRVILNNEHETDYFDCPVGVKQGDCLSPTLFAIFINDLALEIKNSNIGVKLEENLLVIILLYADDIVLLAENEEDLQSLLFIVECWCKKWRLEINLTKTNIMHIRSKRKNQSKFSFLFDMQPVPYCTSYKYLGENLNEFLDYNFTADCLADSAGRALGAIITKMIKNRGFPFRVYTVLYEACVTSIVDYAGEVTGYTQYSRSVQLHTRAIRAFLGLPKNSCNVGVLSEVDWLLPEYRTKIRMIRQYSRILSMSDSRLTKKVFFWDKSCNDTGLVSSWTNEIRNIFYSCGLNSIFDNNLPFSIRRTVDFIKGKFMADQADFLKGECEQQTKLRTFLKFKEFESIPAYVTKPLSFIQKKYLSKLRLGSLELKIETGRYSRPRLELHERLCPICTESRLQRSLEPEIETEIHFLFFCEHFENLRMCWMQKVTKPENFTNLDEGTRLKIVLNDPNNVKTTAQFLVDAFNMRRKMLNK